MADLQKFRDELKQLRKSLGEKRRKIHVMRIGNAWTVVRR